jgi:hypothetical protein
MQVASSIVDNMLSRARLKKTPPSQPWQTLPQPVPLVNVVTESSALKQPTLGSSTTSTPQTPSSQAVRYVATGISTEAEIILSQLPAPLYIVAFAGFGRSGKSYTASKFREVLTGNADYVFVSQPGNIPCTHGIDMMVFKNPKGEGHIILLDCEG